MYICKFYSCHSLFWRWQEYEPICVKVRAHNPLSWNYVCKTAAFEDSLDLTNCKYRITRGIRTSRHKGIARKPDPRYSVFPISLKFLHMYVI